MICRRLEVEIKWSNGLRTAQFVSSPCEKVVEDVKGPLLFGLADGTGFLQQV